MKKIYSVYTDGAYSSLRDQGGIGIVVLKGDTPILEYSNMYKRTSNNQMELGAIILALRMIKENIDSLKIYTDSQYCVGCAIKGWKRKKNIPLWNEFDKEFKRVKSLCNDIQFIHIRGHSGNKYNEIVDKLAVKASQQI